jgi:signal transduction histidine kinase
MVRENPRRGGGAEDGGGDDLAQAQLVLLVRALGLDRAALLLEESPGGAFAPVAVHGRVSLARVAPDGSPGGGPWSAVVTVSVGGRTTGLLLLDRGGGAALSAADQTLATQLAEGAGRVAAHAGLAADLARSHARLARADRLSTLGTLAAGVAHEIRNPLVSVRTFVQLLPERLDDEEFRTAFRDLALGEIERICSLINDLLAFARAAPAQREPTDLNEVTSQIVRLLDAEARKCDVMLTCRPSPGLPLVLVDEAQVKQVLLNVLLNAIEASGAHGTVAVTTGADVDAGCVLVTVADSGPGIPPAELERIFEPFFTTKDTGSGLGLFIAKQIMTRHGGDILAQPRVEGGTEFVMRFRISADEGNAGTDG